MARSGPTVNQAPGEIVVCSDEPGGMSRNEGMRLIAAGQAEPFEVPTGASLVGVDWEMRNLSPERYLELYPTGPNAEKARKVLGIG